MTLPDIATETFNAGFLNLRRKRISIATDFVEFEQTALFGRKTIRLDWNDIASIAYGAEWLPGMYWTTGYKVQVRFLTAKGETYNFSTTAIYGIGAKNLTIQFNQVIGWLWENQLNVRVDQLLSEFDKYQSVLMPGIQFNAIGVRFNGDEIPWNRVVLKDYHGYFYIMDNEKSQSNKKFSFLSDWDAVLIYSVAKSLIDYYSKKDLQTDQM